MIRCTDLVVSPNLSQAEISRFRGPIRNLVSPNNSDVSGAGGVKISAINRISGPEIRKKKVNCGTRVQGINVKYEHRKVCF